MLPRFVFQSETHFFSLCPIDILLFIYFFIYKKKTRNLERVEIVEENMKNYVNLRQNYLENLYSRDNQKNSD